MAANYDAFYIIAALDTDDSSMNTENIKEQLELYPNMSVAWGASANKIHAINRDIPADGWDILLVFSDDMRMQMFGWDILVPEAFEGNLDRFIHFYEPNSSDRVSVMHVVGKKYYDRDGFAYNPAYVSLFCDEEATEVARIRGCYTFFPTQIFYHDNAAITGVGHVDDMLREQQQLGWSIDQQTFLQRKEKNFGL